MKKHIIVIGGGMAGTAAAYSLKKKGYNVTILEKNDRLGGRIHSITTNDTTFEVGAGFVTDFYTNVFAFLQESGLVRYLQIRKSKAAIVKQGKLRQVTSIASIFGSNLVPFYVKKQLFGEFIKLLPAWHMLDMRNLWKASALDKQSVSEALHNKKGQEFVDYLIQPLLDGYCYWSAEKISHAMLLLIFKAALLPHKTYILKCGLQRIPETAAKGSQVLLSHTVTHIKRLSVNEYELTVLANHKTKKLRANGIVCATTVTEVSKMLTLSRFTKINFTYPFVV